MSVCTFFGHRDCPTAVRESLYAALVDLIENHAVDSFYVGNSGAFDNMVQACLQELSGHYPHIRYAVVLERMPGKSDRDFQKDMPDTVLPDGIESVLPKFAIPWRNQWMLDQADMVVSYVIHAGGGAAHFVRKARDCGKAIINLASYSVENL